MEKIKIQIRSRLTGSVLFEYEKEDNTIKDTLIEAIKSDTDLCYADLRYADLRDANLRDANLSRTNLHGANLRDANLSYADLRGANLRYADLSYANLRYADLRYTNVCGANLSRTNLHGTDLRDANLCDAKYVPYIPLSCPSDGAFIGWKKVRGKLVKLQIPEEARRSSATTNKCRCDKALVLSITDLDGQNPIGKIENISQLHRVLYEVGKMVYPDSFDEDRWNECSHGIHFFINKQEAINYQM